MDFNRAFEIVVGFEGGYQSPEEAIQRGDPGGETKYGIAKRSHPTVDIKNLTIDQAKAIYLHEYWGVAGCDAVPDKLKYPLFDMAVNSGPTAAAKAIQKSCGATPDGAIGPKTLMAIQSANQADLFDKFVGERLEFMTDLKNWPQNSRGWAKRIAKILKGI